MTPVSAASPASCLDFVREQRSVTGVERKQQACAAGYGSRQRSSEYRNCLQSLRMRMQVSTVEGDLRPKLCPSLFTPARMKSMLDPWLPALDLALSDELGKTMSSSMIRVAVSDHPGMVFDGAVAHREQVDALVVPDC